MAKRKTGIGQVKHPFLYKVVNGEGTAQTFKSWAVVRMARSEVELVVTLEDAKQALRRHGVGSTSRCTMALCCYRMKAAFGHPVEGHVDWCPTRAFVVTKTKGGLPVECVAYEHSSTIWRLNDTPGGLRKLIARLEKTGPITITLRPYRVRSEVGRSGVGRKTTGTREAVRHGANRRFDVAHVGAPPA
jgi:hypothetical protein